MQFVSKPRREVVWVTIQSVSATGMKQVSLKSKDGPVVLGTGNQVLERESSTQNWGSEGCFEIPKAKLNLSLQRCFPTYSPPSTCGKWSSVFYVWDMNEAIQGQGWEFQGSSLSRGHVTTVKAEEEHVLTTYLQHRCELALRGRSCGPENEAGDALQERILWWSKPTAAIMGENPQEGNQGLWKPGETELSWRLWGCSGAGTTDFALIWKPHSEWESPSWWAGLASWTINYVIFVAKIWKELIRPSSMRTIQFKSGQRN